MGYHNDWEKWKGLTCTRGRFKSELMNMTRGFRGMSGDFRGFWRILGDVRGFQRISGDFRGFQGDTGDYMSVGGDEGIERGYIKRER